MAGTIKVQNLTYEQKELVKSKHLIIHKSKAFLQNPKAKAVAKKRNEAKVKRQIAHRKMINDAASK